MDSSEKNQTSLESTDGPDSNWTEAESLQLIEFYRVSPILWDMNHPDYYKRSKKVNAWKVIAKAMGRKPAACKHKMSVLNSSFRREKAKITYAVSNLQHYASNWFAFSAMSFLLIKERNPTRKVRRKGPRQYYTDTFRATIEAAKEAEKTRKKVFLDSKRNHVLEDLKDRRNIPSTSKPIDVEIKTEEEAEIKTFTSFIATKMKKYSDTTRSSVQQAICDILFKADQGHYNSSSQMVSSTVTSAPVVGQVMTVKKEDLTSSSDIDDSE